MGIKESGWTWTAPLEWAKGSPWRQEGVDGLPEPQRLQMAAVLANKELGFLDRRLARAFRDPRDLKSFLLAGVEEWGVDPKFAPMRALRRAEQMERFLEQPPASSGAAWAWKNAPDGFRSSGLAGRLSPSNAFTLMFKRRALPELAAASMALKSVWSAGALTAAALAPSGAPIVTVFLGAAVIAKALEVGMSDHDRGGPRELWALRKAASSSRRLERLAKEAFERARALGHRLQGEPESVGADPKEAASQAKAFLKEAKRIDQERQALLKGDLLGALDRSERAAGLKNKADELRQKASRMLEAQRSARAPSFGDIQGHLRCFAQEARKKGWFLVELDQLRGAGQTRLESAELEGATRQAPKAIERGAAAGAARLGRARL